MEDKKNRLKTALAGIKTWKIIVFLLLLIFFVVAIFMKYFGSGDIQNFGDVSLTVTGSLEIAFTLSITININYTNNKKINDMRKATINYPKFINGDNYEVNVPVKTVEENQYEILCSYLTYVSSIEKSVQDLKRTRDNYDLNALIEKKKIVDKKIQDLDNSLAPITKSGEKSDFIEECLKIIYDYLKNVAALLRQIHDDIIHANVEYMRNPKEFYNGFDEAYKKIDGVSVKLPPRSNNN